MADGNYAACIEACEKCADACDRCAASCLQEAEVARMTQCIRLDLDCAQLCRVAVALMARDSAYTDDICRLCADICDACGDECGRHDMTHCKECSQACHACAVACRHMSGELRGGTPQALAPAAH